jgi:7,8-dihydropterin-6-yl-methyl-4-(beta-D-ribofuranosyl)aminobenzene 5'-phosphate synthase
MKFYESMAWVQFKSQLQSKQLGEVAMTIELRSVDKVEILTLQDNRIDLVAQDNNEVVQRPIPLEGTEFRKSIRAEHGFSTLITINHNGTQKQLLFDFGFSEDGAAENATVLNATVLNANLSQVELLVLSH